MTAQMKTAIFSHGKESGPDGNKIKILRKVAELYDLKTYSLDYTQCKNATERVSLLEGFIDRTGTEHLLLIGSSMGGYVSTVVSNVYPLAGLFLLCPALYMPSDEYEVQHYLPMCNHIEIIHGWNDDIVRYENSVKFGQQTKAVVNLINDDHRLKNSYSFMEKRFALFMEKLNLS